MANLGSITYSSVVWTTGDVITEAKLDNMVANEQAYDSHAAQGLLLDNGKAYCSKDSGGTARDIMRLNSSNIVEISAIDGWNYLPTSNVPTYASATTITNPTGIDWTTYLRKGDKISFVQTTTKFFYVVAVTATTLTLTGGADYTVANAAISSFKYSKDASPQGFPLYFTWTPTYAGFSVNPTATNRFSLIDGRCFAASYITGYGTSNTTGFTITLPIAAGVAQIPSGKFLGHDNGVSGANEPYGTLSAASATMTLFKDHATTAWTASGAKGCYFDISYMI